MSCMAGGCERSTSPFYIYALVGHTLAFLPGIDTKPRTGKGISEEAVLQVCQSQL